MDGNQDEPKSLLANLRTHHVVNVHNPLTTSDDGKFKGDFTWQIARSVVQDDPAFRDPIIKQLNMRNDSHPTQKHVTQTITIPSGKSMKLPGDVAQIFVKHLVDEMLSRRGYKSTISDPTLRRECEEEVVLNINDLRSQLSNLDIQTQLDQQIADLNKTETITRTQDDKEPAFPELQPANRAETPSTASGTPGAAAKLVKSPAPAATK